MSSVSDADLEFHCCNPLKLIMIILLAASDADSTSDGNEDFDAVTTVLWTDLLALLPPVFRIFSRTSSAVVLNARLEEFFNGPEPSHFPSHEILEDSGPSLLGDLAQ